MTGVQVPDERREEGYLEPHDWEYTNALGHCQGNSLEHLSASPLAKPGRDHMVDESEQIS